MSSRANQFFTRPRFKARRHFCDSIRRDLMHIAGSRLRRVADQPDDIDGIPGFNRRVVVALHFPFAGIGVVDDDQRFTLHQSLLEFAKAIVVRGLEFGWIELICAVPFEVVIGTIHLRAGEVLPCVRALTTPGDSAHDDHPPLVVVFRQRHQVCVF